MANPITWRNIAAPNFSGASNMMGKAQESFTGALDALGETKDQFEQGRTERNTQDFMAELSKYRTPEELAAAQESGAIDAMRQQFGANGLIDQEKTDAGAIRDTLTGLRETRVADREYQDSETEFGNREARDNAQAALASGNLERFDEILGNNEFLNQGELAQDRAAAADRIRQREFADERRGREQTLFEQSQSDREETKAEESAVDLGTRRVNEIVASTDSAAEARAATQAFLQSPEAASIPPAQRNKLQADAAPMWAQNNGLTQAQSETLDSTRQGFQAEADDRIARAELRYEEQKARHPVNEQLSFMDENRITRGDALSYVESEESGVDELFGWGKSNVEDAIAATVKDRNISDDANVPWGNIIKMAVDEAKEPDVLSSGYDLDSGDINRTMKAVYDEWLKSEKNRRIVEDAERSLLDEQKAASEYVRAGTSSEKARIRKANEDLRNFRSNK